MRPNVKTISVRVHTLSFDSLERHIPLRQPCMSYSRFSQIHRTYKISPTPNKSYLIFYISTLLLRIILFFYTRYRPVEEEVDHRRNLLGGYRQNRRPFPLSENDAAPYRTPSYSQSSINMNENSSRRRQWTDAMPAGQCRCGEAKCAYRRNGYIYVWMPTKDNEIPICPCAECELMKSDRATERWRSWLAKLL